LNTVDAQQVCEAFHTPRRKFLETNLNRDAFATPLIHPPAGSQRPFVQIPVALGGAGHTRPQAPQFRGSLIRSVQDTWQHALPASQQPLPHAKYSALHTKPHAPLAQVGVEFAGTGQARPQAPQCCRLVLRFEQ
jgi:hypothetical protein